MQKTCSQCQATKPLGDFHKRAASPDGYAPLCKACKNLAAKLKYTIDDATRAQSIARTVQNKRLRLAADPAYKRAFNLWGSTKRRTAIPPWVSIMDFYAVCTEAVAAGPGYVVDHIVPLKHPLVCGLHVPWNVRVLPKAHNDIKGNSLWL
jgi:hypothetical protein